jgi:serine/threonine protein kinase
MSAKKSIKLSDYQIGVTLGTGSFGRVKLTKHKKTGEYSALKILKKHDIIKLKQVDHVISENTILIDVDHPFGKFI